jgi:hypothetical protein
VPRFRVKEKRISGTGRGGSRRRGDPPAWLDETLPLEERRALLDRAIRIARPSQQEATQPLPGPAQQSDPPERDSR